MYGYRSKFRRLQFSLTYKSVNFTLPPRSRSPLSLWSPRLSMGLYIFKPQFSDVSQFHQIRSDDHSHFLTNLFLSSFIGFLIIGSIAFRVFSDLFWFSMAHLYSSYVICVSSFNISVWRYNNIRHQVNLFPNIISPSVYRVLLKDWTTQRVSWSDLLYLLFCRWYISNLTLMDLNLLVATLSTKVSVTSAWLSFGLIPGNNSFALRIFPKGFPSSKFQRLVSALMRFFSKTNEYYSLSFSSPLFLSNTVKQYNCLNGNFQNSQDIIGFAFAIAAIFVFPLIAD